MIIEFWTQNLNPITCYQAQREVRKKEKVVIKAPTLNERINRERAYKRTNTQKLTLEDNYGQQIKFDSVIEAAEFLKIKTETLYAIINNRLKNKTNYKFYKS